MNSNEITRETAKKITTEIETAIKDIFTKNGLSAAQYKTTYGDRYELKILATKEQKSATGENINSIEAQAFLRNATSHGITDPQSCFEKPIHIRGKVYALVGYKPRSKRRPFILREIPTGKTYIFPRETAQHFPSYDATQDWVTKYEQMIED